MMVSKLTFLLDCIRNRLFQHMYKYGTANGKREAYVGNLTSELMNRQKVSKIILLDELDMKPHIIL